VGEITMPATILPFVRREPSPPAVRPPAMPGLRPTSRQIAHRWAMLSHLTRHYPRRLSAPPPKELPDTVR